MNCLLVGWPEPVVRVQSLSESGLKVIPDRYVKPPSDRPNSTKNVYSNDVDTNIPIIDLSNPEGALRRKTMGEILSACREWGFFQVVNHGIKEEVLARVKEVWREFFELPLEVKQEYANLPSTYEGYGSRLGVKKDAILDWSDYYFLNLFPVRSRDMTKWPLLPSSCREIIGEYGEESLKLCEKLMKLFSLNLGLKEDHLQNCFGGPEKSGACLRVNFYPKCPQPDLTFGLSSHSDPGGMTLLLSDDDVAGLQVRKGDSWITVKPVPNAIVVNIGDQIQVLSNAIYKSVEHRVIVNSMKDRVSLAFFYNPKSDLLIEPIKELVNEDEPAMYQRPMTFDQYRLYIRAKGPCGKSQIDYLIANNQGSKNVSPT